MGRKTKLVQIIEETLSEHKAECIKTIDVKSRTPFADYYILANGLNVRHIDALKEAVIEKLGGKASGSVSSKTSYLINNDITSRSSKNVKAAELGIPVITEEDFIAMLPEELKLKDVRSEG